VTPPASSGNASDEASDEASDPAPSDADLLRRHVDGDGDAFGVLFARHQDRLWAVALRTLGDREEAADALQDAMVKAFRSAAGFRGDAAVTTWLHRIVVNACIDRTRRSAARPTDPLPDGPDRTRTAAPLTTVTDDVVRHEQQLDVLRALHQLPLDQRAAVVLVDMEGYSVDEASRMLQCPPGTIKSRCSRARARLVPLLAAWNQRPAQDVPSAANSPRTQGGAP